MLTMPIIVLFYQNNGMNMKDVLLLQGIYSIAIVALEIPSGYFADLWGRKPTIVLGSILGTLGFAIYSVTDGFWGFLIAELTLGVGQSFISGSDSALLYDSLKADHKSNEYVKMEGRIASLGNFAETGAAIIGGFLAELSLRTPFIMQTLVAAIAIPASLSLVEPPANKPQFKAWKSLIGVLKETFSKNKSLVVLILYTAIIGTGTLTMAWLIQPFLNQIQGMEYSQMGIVLALLNLVVGLVTLVSYKIEQRFESKWVLLAISLGIGLPYFLMGYFEAPLILSVVFLFYAFRGLATPVLKDYINRSSPSEIRATIMSIRNFAIRLIFALIGPLLGWFTDVYSLQIALYMGGFIILISSSISLGIYFMMQKSNSSFSNT